MSKPTRTSTRGLSRHSGGHSKPSVAPQNSLRMLLNLLLKKSGLIFALTALGSICGFGVLLFQPELYRARTSVEVLGINETFMGMDRIDPQAGLGNYGSTAVNIQTQLKLIESPTMISRLHQKLQAELIPAKMEQVRFGGLKSKLGIGQEEPAVVLRKALQTAAMTVSARPISGTRIIEISCDSTTPEVAARFANGLADEYMDQAMQSRVKSLQGTAEWLARQVEQSRAKLDATENKLQAFVRSAGVAFVAADENLSETKLKQLQGELSATQSERISKQSRYEMAIKAAPEALPEVLQDLTLLRYQSDLTDLRRQMAQLTSTYTANHPKVERVQVQINEVERAMKVQRDSVLRRIQSEYEASKSREKLLQGAFSSQASNVVAQSSNANDHNTIKREVDVARQQYNMMLQQLQQAGMASMVPNNSFRVVDQAYPPTIPFAPRPAIVVGFGAITGFFLACLIAYGSFIVDSRLRLPGESTTLLSVPELGVIPSANFDPSRRGLMGITERVLARRGLGNASDLPGLGSGAANRVELTTWNRRNTLLAESFRLTLASLFTQNREADVIRVIAMMSPGVGEGKTTICSNTAIAIAETKRKTVLIDGDLRRPRLDRVFGVENMTGFSDVITSSKPINTYTMAELVQPSAIPNLFIMPSGNSRENITTILYSPRVLELLEWLRRHFDVIVIDTPPLLQFFDARLFGRTADGVILVTRAEVTSTANLMAASQMLEDNNIPLLGTILNDWNPDITDSKQYRRYYEAYHSYMENGRVDF